MEKPLIRHARDPVQKQNTVDLLALQPPRTPDLGGDSPLTETFWCCSRPPTPRHKPAVLEVANENR